MPKVALERLVETRSAASRREECLARLRVEPLERVAHRRDLVVEPPSGAWQGATRVHEVRSGHAFFPGEVPVPDVAADATQPRERPSLDATPPPQPQVAP
jgi:hypothetical protein